MPVQFFTQPVPGAWTEYEWECVELSMRFMYLAYGVAPYSSNGNDVVDNYTSRKYNPRNYNNPILVPVTNNGKSKIAPQPGDILSYTSASSFGHTSVVTTTNVDSTGKGTITTLEQNSSPTGTATLTVKNWVINSGIKNWLHHTLDVAPQSGFRDTSVQFSGTGFKANEPITITFVSNGSTEVVGGATADKSGAFSTTFSVPSTAQPGTYTIQATGSNSKFAPRTVFYVIAPPTPINLDPGTDHYFNPLGISDSGIVGGDFYYASEGGTHAGTWQANTDNQFSNPDGVAYGISSAGEVVGLAQHAETWNSSGTGTDLGGPTTGSCDPSTGITLADAENNVGDIAGYCYGTSPGDFHAGYWPGGTPNSFTRLPDISNASGYSYAMGINHSRSIIGFAGFYDPNNAALGVVNHGVLWQNGTATDINPPSAVSSQPVAINDNNLAVGNVTFSESDPNNHAYVWDLTKNARYDLYAQTGYSGTASAINNSGLVVGYYDTHNGDPYTENHAFIWKVGATFVDLNELIDQNSGWTLVSAVGINSSGQIVGTGFKNGEFHHYLLNVPLAALT